VVGKTIPQVETLVREAVKEKDQQAINVTVRLVGKPSAVYYVFGEVNAPGVFPVTGRETVLDGVVAAGGLTRKASVDNIIVSRPTAPESCRFVYPVCWRQIVQLGDTSTNYQLLPGDRIYVPSQGTLESLLPSRCQKPNPACCRPQTSCFGSGTSNATNCAPGSHGPGMLPLDVQVPSTGK
jgi:protein involved in polysaccharide export with SLBB domain